MQRKDNMSHYYGVKFLDGYSQLFTGKVEENDYCYSSRTNDFQPIKKEKIGHKVENFYCVIRNTPISQESLPQEKIQATFLTNFIADLIDDSLDTRQCVIRLFKHLEKSGYKFSTCELELLDGLKANTKEGVDYIREVLKIIKEAAIDEV